MKILNSPQGIGMGEEELVPVGNTEEACVYLDKGKCGHVGLQGKEEERGVTAGSGQ